MYTVLIQAYPNILVSWYHPIQKDPSTDTLCINKGIVTLIWSMRKWTHSQFHKEPEITVFVSPYGSFEKSYCRCTLSPCFPHNGTDRCSNPFADPRTREPVKTIQSSSPNRQTVKPNLKEFKNFAQIHGARISPDGQLSLPAQKWMSLIKQKGSLVQGPAPPTPQNTQLCSSLTVLSGEKRTFLAVLWNSFGAKLLKTDMCPVFTSCWSRQLVRSSTFRSLMETIWEAPGVCFLFYSVCIWPPAKIRTPALPLRASEIQLWDGGCRKLCSALSRNILVRCFQATRKQAFHCLCLKRLLSFLFYKRIMRKRYE